MTKAACYFPNSFPVAITVTRAKFRGGDYVFYKVSKTSKRHFGYIVNSHFVPHEQIWVYTFVYAPESCAKVSKPSCPQTLGNIPESQLEFKKDKP